MRQRADVSAKPPVFFGPEHVVDEAEEREADASEQHERPGEVETGFVAEPERAEHGSSGLDAEHREHREDAGRGRYDPIAIVATLQHRHREHVAGGEHDEADREHPDDERE